jgi:uncharacterized membrane protein YbhN (UPF0104 family)
VGKALLAVAIVYAIGQQFVRDLQRPELSDLWEHSVGADWLVLSGVLYLAALGCWALVWYRLMLGLGQAPSPVATIRAYYLGHLGKYVPGKAWALVMRATLVAGPRVRPSVAGVTAFYEVLVNMSGGVLLAAVLFLLLAPDNAVAMDWETFRRLFRLEAPDTSLIDRKILVLLALLLLLPIGLLVLPPIFNHIAQRFTKPFRDRDAAPLPPIRVRSLLQSLVIAGCSWCLLGASLWVMLQAVAPRPPTLDYLGIYIAFMGMAYVAGFIILLVPSGLGVREFFLVLFLTTPLAGLLGSQSPQEVRAVAVLTVLLLRLVWTTGEVIVAGIVYWLPCRSDQDIANCKLQIANCKLAEGNTPTNAPPDG